MSMAKKFTPTLVCFATTSPLPRFALWVSCFLPGSSVIHVGPCEDPTRHSHAQLRSVGELILNQMGNESQLANAFHLLEKHFWDALHIFFRRFPWYLASTNYNSKFTQCVLILTSFYFNVDDTQKGDWQFCLRKEHNSWPPCHEVPNFRQWHLWEKRTYQKFWKFM